MDEDFEDPRGGLRGDDNAFVLRLDSYEGPIDALLEQAREQKVDLTQISILALADQYLGFIERARALRLELAADYLVMAAWLAYLKSRLLLPPDEDDDEPSGEELAAALAFQLQRLEAMRDAGTRLMARPMVGRDWFARGEPPPDLVVRTTVYDLSLYDLLKAYGTIQGRNAGGGALHIQASNLFSTEAALERLTAMLGRVPGWATLFSFLPADLKDPLQVRSAIASHFSASLELAKAGKLAIRQDGAFQPIFLKRTEEP